MIHKALFSWKLKTKNGRQNFHRLHKKPKFITSLVLFAPHDCVSLHSVGLTFASSKRTKLCDIIKVHQKNGTKWCNFSTPTHTYRMRHYPVESRSIAWRSTMIDCTGPATRRKVLVLSKFWQSKNNC